jgi:hypothetical protein
MAKRSEWTVLYDAEFRKWLGEQDLGIQDEILSYVALLMRFGPNLGRPRVDTVKGSAFANMKELRIQFGGKPWRILFAFDPNRAAVLLVGGCKVGDPRWYKQQIPIADAKFRRHLQALKKG